MNAAASTPPDSQNRGDDYHGSNAQRAAAHRVARGFDRRGKDDAHPSGAIGERTRQQFLARRRCWKRCGGLLESLREANELATLGAALEVPGYAAALTEI